MAEEEISVAAVEAASSKQDNNIVHCPGPDEVAFVTNCGGGNVGSGGNDQLMKGKPNNNYNNQDDYDDDEHAGLDADEQTPSAQDSSSDDDDDFHSEEINNDVHTSQWKNQPQEQYINEWNESADSKSGHMNHGQQQHQEQQRWIDGIICQEQRQQQQQQQQQQSTCNNNAFTSTTSTSSDDNEFSVYHQLKKTTATFVHRHYTPLPQRGKCAIGSACGFLASRLSLGVANRIFRVAGATWVFSEAIHASGLCDETSCAVIPEEARPWIVILRRSIGQKVESVRRMARKLWNKERIREMARQDEALACGLAAGAFVGFIV